MDKISTRFARALGTTSEAGPSDALRAGAAVRRAAAAAGPAAAPALLRAYEGGDRLARVLVLHALAAAGGPEADEALAAALSSGELRTHAAWALEHRPPQRALMPALTSLVGVGGFGAMVAGLTLERWHSTAPGAVVEALWEAESAADGPVRDRLRDARVGCTAPPVVAPARAARADGLRVVQILLQGRVDAAITAAGAGDGGGLSTLVVHLARELASRPEVAEVVTVARAFTDDEPGAHARLAEHIAPGARIERIPFGPPGYVPTPELWEHRAAIERELAALLARVGPVDAVHLRFADAGTLAASRVCERAGIPVVFTLAPDPHVVLEEAERAGDLDRDGLVDADAREHVVFRARLVEHMLATAHRLALLPRAGARPELRRLLGMPLLGSRRGRVRTVPEGISLRPLDDARRARAGGVEPPVLGRLCGALSSLPAARRGLPLLLSVGRLHPVKGFDRLVRAWAGDPELLAAFNLVVVGGDLERPTPTEEAVLGELALAVGAAPGAADGFVLLGHQPHDDVAHLLVAAREGLPPQVAPGGIYACASAKEEFGLALLEALAAGLPVVAPAAGGPPTYVEHGVTGFLAPPLSVDGLRTALRGAAAVRLDDRRAARAERTVRRRHTLEAMAAGLVDLYATATPEAVAA
ncbi:MAG: glycosyltransferase [Pseudomonadota bacterium]